MASPREPDEDLIVRYLLGADVDQQDIEELEARYFQDDARFRTMMRVEDRLIAEYLRGELTGEDARLFETRFLASERRRKKWIEAARSLVPNSSGAPIRWRMFPNRIRVGLALAGGACAAALVTTGFFAVQRGADVRRLQARVQALESSAAVQHSVAAFILSPGLTRSDQGTRIRIPPGTLWIVLRLLVYPSPSSPTTYESQLATPEGAVFDRQAGLVPRGADPGHSVSIMLPVRKIPPGDYVLSLTGTSGSGRLALPSYVFRVEPN
jgi:hypothetical protein